MPLPHGRLLIATLCLVVAVACGRPAPDSTGAGTSAPPPSPAAPAPPDTPAAPAPLAPPPPATTEAAAPTAPGAPAPVASPAPAPAAPAAPPPPDVPPAPPGPPAAPARPAPAVRPAPPREVSIPAGTPLRLALLTAVASDTSAVEDRVSARLTDPVVIGGDTVIPEGARVAGEVTYVKGSGKVKGRGALTVRFRSITVGERTYDLDAEPLRREARGTKARDARDIGIGAGAGAVIGGIIGGRKGAGIGAAVGGAGGTGVVLATKGEEVRLPAGTAVTSRLESPLVVQLRVTGPPR